MRALRVVCLRKGCREYFPEVTPRRMICNVHLARSMCPLPTPGKSFMRMATAQWMTHRWCASSCQSPSAEEILKASKWQSARFEERLGFRPGEAITEESLKRHFHVLVKHHHPDTAPRGTEEAARATTSVDPSSQPDGEAFRRVKEAYDEISATLKKGGRWDAGRAEANFATEFAGGFQYSDEARRRSQMRLLGDAVLLFLFMTVMFIVIVSRHNKSRMQSRHLGHLLWIFVMIQLFPRILAAALLFAAHSMYLLENATLKEQATISVVVARGKDGCTVKLDGIDAEALPNVVVQVTTTATGGSSKNFTEEVASTLTFDAGVSEFLLPLPTHSNGLYHVRAVDEKRKLVLVDRTVSPQLKEIQV